jgi:hypothetical protein
MQPNRILPDLQFSMVCEQVRQEANGNFFVIGLLNFIVVPGTPVTLPALPVFNRWCCGVGQFKETVRLVAPDLTTELAKGDVKFALRDPALNVTNLNVLRDVVLKAPGVYHLEVIVDDVLKLRYPLPLVIPQTPPQTTSSTGAVQPPPEPPK